MLNYVCKQNAINCVQLTFNEIEVVYLGVKKTRNWDFLIYPESAPEDWLHTLEGLKGTFGVSPIHDKDVMPDGSLKKPHYHCIAIWDGPRTLELTQEILSGVTDVLPIPCLSLRGSARYFWHLDNPEKYQYRDMPICLGGFDFYGLINMPSDNIKVLREIRNWCKKYSVFSLDALMEYAELRQPSWEIYLQGHYNFVVKILRSIEYDFNTNIDSSKAVKEIITLEEIEKNEN